MNGFIYGMLFGATMACLPLSAMYRKLEARHLRELNEQDKWWSGRLNQLRERVNPWAKIQDYINALPEYHEVRK